MKSLECRLNELFKMLKCIQQKGCLCFSEETALEYNDETGRLDSTYTDGSTRSVDLPVIKWTSQLLNNGQLTDPGEGYLMRSNFGMEEQGEITTQIRDVGGISEEEKKRVIEKLAYTHVVTLNSHLLHHDGNDWVKTQVRDVFPVYNAVTKLSFDGNVNQLTYVDEANSANVIDLDSIHVKYTSDLVNNGSAKQGSTSGFVHGDDVEVKLVENFTAEEKNAIGIGNHDSVKVVTREYTGTDVYVKNLMYLQSLRMQIPQFERVEGGRYEKRDARQVDFPIYQSVTKLQLVENALLYTDELGVVSRIPIAFNLAVDYSSAVPTESRHLIGNLSVNNREIPVHETVTSLSKYVKKDEENKGMPDPVVKNVLKNEAGHSLEFYTPRYMNFFYKHDDRHEEVEGQFTPGNRKIASFQTVDLDPTLFDGHFKHVGKDNGLESGNNHIYESVTHIKIKEDRTGFQYVNEEGTIEEVNFPLGAGGADTVTRIEVNEEGTGFTYYNELGTAQEVLFPPDKVCALLKAENGKYIFTNEEKTTTEFTIPSKPKVLFVDENEESDYLFLILSFDNIESRVIYSNGSEDLTDFSAVRIPSTIYSMEDLYKTIPQKGEGQVLEVSREKRVNVFFEKAYISQDIEELKAVKGNKFQIYETITKIAEEPDGSGFRYVDERNQEVRIKFPVDPFYEQSNEAFLPKQFQSHRIKTVNFMTDLGLYFNNYGLTTGGKKLRNLNLLCDIPRRFIEFSKRISGEPVLKEFCKLNVLDDNKSAGMFTQRNVLFFSAPSSGYINEYSKNIRESSFTGFLPLSVSINKIYPLRSSRFLFYGNPSLPTCENFKIDRDLRHLVNDFIMINYINSFYPCKNDRSNYAYLKNFEFNIRPEWNRVNNVPKNTRAILKNNLNTTSNAIFTLEYDNTSINTEKEGIWDFSLAKRKESMELEFPSYKTAISFFKLDFTESSYYLFLKTFENLIESSLDSFTTIQSGEPLDSSAVSFEKIYSINMTFCVDFSITGIFI